MPTPPRRTPRLGGRIGGLLAIAGLTLTGCMGSFAVRSTRLAYNQSYTLTNDQEILLNIVRLRYAESPNFMDLPAITSQIEASSNGNGESTMVPGLGTWGGLFHLRDAPTLSYAPRTGYNVTATLFKTLSAETMLDISPGGNSEIFFLAFVDSINGVRNAPLATSAMGKVLDSNEGYRYGIKNFIDLQQRGGIGLRIAACKQASSKPVRVTMMSGSDLVNAAEKDIEFQNAGEQVEAIRDESVLAAVIDASELDSPEVAEITSIFKLRPGRTVYRVMSMEKNRIHLDGDGEHEAMTVGTQDGGGVELLPDPVAGPSLDGTGTAGDIEGPHDEAYDSETEITINVRSGYQIMAFLSKGVDVPRKHLGSGIAPSFCGLDGRPFDPRQLTRGFFHVRVQKHRPWNTSLAVHYRGHWFYIAEEDAKSRAVLNLLEMILGLQLQDKSQGPVLTLPIN